MKATTATATVRNPYLKKKRPRPSGVNVEEESSKQDEGVAIQMTPESPRPTPQQATASTTTTTTTKTTFKPTTIHNPYLKKKRPRPSNDTTTTTCTAATESKMTATTPPPQSTNTTAAASAAALEKDSKISIQHGSKVAVATEGTVAAAAAAVSEQFLPSTSNLSKQSSASASALVIAASDKAGMQGIDRARIDAIILRESGNSSFIQQQRRRDEQVNRKIAKLQHELAQAPPGWEKEVHKQLFMEIPGILAQRPTRSTTVVVDLDMFYFACELLSKPELKDKPACVGHGMILTSNYKARTYGVRSAMAGWIGDKLVEELSGGKEKLIHVPSNFPLYKEKSKIVKQVLSEYDPHLKSYSLDEAYMNLAPYLALKLSRGWNHEEIAKALAERKAEAVIKDSGWTESQSILASYSSALCLETAGQMIASMRQAVCHATGGLTCSAGLAPNVLLAKIASDRNKPNGQCLVGPDHETDVVPFLYPLPVRKVGGIGRVTEKTLQAFGIETVRDLYEQRALIRFLFKPATAANLLHASLGCSSRDDGGDAEDDNENGEDRGLQKGISRERTFMAGRPWAEINAKLEEIAHLLSSDMAGKNLWARTITVKVKLSSFDVLSRSKSLPHGVFIQQASDLVALASEILRRIREAHTGPQFSVRLLGIRMHNFRTDEDTATGTFRLEDCFRDLSSPRKAARKTAPGQRSLDSFVSQARIDASTSSAAEEPKRTQKREATQERVLCPVCQQASFLANEINALNRHIDQCLAPSKPAAKKSRLQLYFGK